MASERQGFEPSGAPVSMETHDAVDPSSSSHQPDYDLVRDRPQQRRWFVDAFEPCRPDRGGTSPHAPPRRRPERLVAIPSVSGVGVPPEPLFAAHDFVVERLREPPVWSRSRNWSSRARSRRWWWPRCRPRQRPPRPCCSTRTTTSFPAGDESLWESPPFEAVERDGAIYGRGTADSKANLISIIGALEVYDGRPPVGVTVIFEGQEEVGSPFDDYPPSAPELFRADAMVIADVGSVRPGTPTLTVALRGSAAVDVEVRSLVGDKHSGVFGGCRARRPDRTDEGPRDDARRAR
jgi:hypothetical protein